jgi:hypothetical protein
MLCELPPMSFQINALIHPVTPELIGGRTDDFGAMRYSALIVGIDIVDEDIQPRYNPALNRLRAYPIRIFSRQPQHYKTVCHFQFGVNDPTGLVSHSQAHFEAKSIYEPVRSRGNIIIKNVGSNPGHVLRRILGHSEVVSLRSGRGFTSSGEFFSARRDQVLRSLAGDSKDKQLYNENQSLCPVEAAAGINKALRLALSGFFRLEGADERAENIFPEIRCNLGNLL